MIFQNDFWELLKLFRTALMLASDNGHVEIVKMLVEQEGIDINAKGVYLFHLIFISIILFFKIILGDY